MTRPGGAEKGCILVIDDDVAMLATVRRVLEAHGFEVLAADGGREATEILEGRRVDLILTDINMPLMDGIEVIAWVRERFDLPILAMSGGGLFRKEELLKDALTLGADDALQKPLRIDTLLQKVDAALRLREGR